MSARTFGGRRRPGLKPIKGEPGFFEDARGGVYMADQANPSRDGTAYLHPWGSTLEPIHPRAVTASLSDNGSKDGSREVDHNGSREDTTSKTTALAAALGITRPFDTSPCVLLGHDDCTGELYRAQAHGYFRYRCAGGWTGGLAEVRASMAYGEPRELSKLEAARWRERLEFDAGIRTAKNIPIELTADVSASARIVAAGISLFLGLRDPRWGDQPWTFTRRFARAYCGVSEDVARRGLKELRELKAIIVVDEVALGPVRRAHLWRLPDPEAER